MTTCTICGYDGKIVEHHVDYEAGETVEVCESCHTRIHRYEDFRPDLTPDNVPEGRRWANDGVHVELTEEAHRRLSRFGHMTETLSDAVIRAVEEAEDERGDGG